MWKTKCPIPVASGCTVNSNSGDYVVIDPDGDLIQVIPGHYGMLRREVMVWAREIIATWRESQKQRGAI